MEKNFVNLVIICLLVFFSIFMHYVNISNRNKYSASLILLITGISIILFRMKISDYIGVLIFLTGLLWIIILSEKEYTSKNLDDNLRLDLINIFSLEGNLVPFFHYIGIIVIFANLTIEFIFSDAIIGQSSQLVLAFSLLMIFYNYIPNKYWKERDFGLIFFGLLIIFVVLPSLLFTFLIHLNLVDANSISNPVFINLFLGRPLANFLNLLGYQVVSDGDIIYYEDLTTQITVSVWIAKSCSGYYSVVIFLAAYISYYISLNRNYGYDFLLFLLIGIMLSYLANLLRMAIIIIVGHYKGAEALVWTHNNVGWLIFTLWIFVFWHFLSKFQFMFKE